MENLIYGGDPWARTRSRVRPSTNEKAAARPKVVSIPIYYVKPKPEMSEPASAAKIQKVCRGFLVRKSLKKILEIGSEVDDLERRVSAGGLADTIRKDPKERLRVSEALMALLLRLDSVRVTGVGIRDCRRAVIKKAIRLQESVDSMAVSSDDVSSVDEKGAILECQSMDVDNTPPVLEDSDKVWDECVGGADCCKDPDSGETDMLEPIEESKSYGGADLDVVNDAGRDGVGHVEPEGGQKAPKSGGDGEKVVAVALSGGVDELDASESEGDTTPRSGDGGSVVDAVVSGGVELNANPMDDEPKTGTDSQSPGGGGGGGEPNRKIMERLMEQNAKLMGLVAELNERNAVQTQLMGTLVQRVEQLERDFVSEKLKRKKKKAQWCVVDSPDSKELEDEYSLI